MTDLTAAENVALPLELGGTGTRAARKAAVSALDEVGLSTVADRFPTSCPAGNSSASQLPGHWWDSDDWYWPTSQPAL